MSIYSSHNTYPQTFCQFIRFMTPLGKSHNGQVQNGWNLIICDVTVQYLQRCNMCEASNERGFCFNAEPVSFFSAFCLITDTTYEIKLICIHITGYGHSSYANYDKFLSPSVSDQQYSVQTQSMHTVLQTRLPTRAVRTEEI